MKMNCSTIHNCLKVHEDNRTLRKALRQLKQKYEDLERELNGFREREKIQDILRTHVNTRNSFVQTDPVDEWNMAANAVLNRRAGRFGATSSTIPIAQQDANQAVVKLVNMQNSARNNYEREIKKNSELSKQVAAQEIRITQLEDDLELSRKECTVLTEKNSELRNTLRQRSGSALRRLETKVTRMRQENSALRDELRGLDSGFFDEVEDLKYALAEARRLLSRYEIYCAGLASRLGVSPPTLEAVSAALTNTTAVVLADSETRNPPRPVVRDVTPENRNLPKPAERDVVAETRKHSRTDAGDVTEGTRNFSRPAARVIASETRKSETRSAGSETRNSRAKTGKLLRENVRDRPSKTRTSETPPVDPSRTYVQNKRIKP